MNNQKKYDVFLSYASNDREWVKAFSNALKEEGLTTWFDVAELPPGSRWQDEVQEALRTSKTLIVFLSSTSVKNQFIFFELGAALADQKQIIPVLINDLDIQEMPIQLRQFQLSNRHSAG
ncbi:toll/interleukin-1 receptor domain-containing protein [Nodosilinea sp. AN01ver1]|uniref:toll/interleukin-1 receptor domain-containing protein n=1 Tax=Nodosilinea sp. AN01ver1 TaxID=3423362 RepID=UPI003D31D77B